MAFLWKKCHFLIFLSKFWAFQKQPKTTFTNLFWAAFSRIDSPMSCLYIPKSAIRNEQILIDLCALFEMVLNWTDLQELQKNMIFLQFLGKMSNQWPILNLPPIFKKCPWIDVYLLVPNLAFWNIQPRYRAFDPKKRGSQRVRKSRFWRILKFPKIS